MHKPKRLAILLGFLLVCFIALYTWDARTGKLSRLAGAGGLEVVKNILYPGVWLRDRVSSFIDDYVALIGVAEENARLREELGLARQRAVQQEEERKELERLRALLNIPSTPPWGQTGARVVAAKFGPQAVMNSVILNKGFVSGVSSGSPVSVRRGLVGRILHTAPSSSSMVLVNDPSFRVAVVGQQSRVRGILAGDGALKPLQVLYVSPNSRMQEGELLICSGIDGSVPPGMPAARVTSVLYDKDLLFPEIKAEPLVELEDIEEVVVLVPPKPGKPDSLVYDFIPGSASGDEQSLEGISGEEAARRLGID